MTRANRPLDNPINWSLRIGRLFGIDIRLHMAFLLGGVLLLWMELPDPGSTEIMAWGRILIDALGTYLILFVVVLAHELGHCFGARYVGGEANEILLWPLGGLAYADVPHDPQANMMTAVAGPLVNVVFCALSSTAIVLWFGSLGAVPWNPLHPFTPPGTLMSPSEGQLWLLRFFGINYVLLLFNLLPIYPLDGGRMLQARLWPTRGYRASMETATGVGMVGAIVLGIFGLFSGQDFLLLAIAVFGYLSCWQTRRLLAEEAEFDSGAFGYDFSRGYGSFETVVEKPPGRLARWKARRAAARLARLRRKEQAHEDAVEMLLRKVAQSGLHSLTRRERKVLQDETRRRQRRDQSTR